MENLYQSPESDVVTEVEYEAVPEDILHSIRHAWIVCAILVTVGTVVTSFFILSGNSASELFSADNFYDYLLVAFLGIGIYRKSRTAAVLMVIYYLITSLIIMTSFEKIGGLLMRITVLYFLIRGMIGTFKYHNHFKSRDKYYKATKSWVPWVLAPVIFVVCLILLLGIMSIMGKTVPTNVMTGDEVTQDYKNILIDNGIINKDEKIVYFYSEAFSNILDAGNLLMEDRVISYETVDQQLSLYSSDYESIEYAMIDTKGGLLSDTYIYILTKEGDSFYLLATVENDGDVVMFDFLQKQIEEHSQKTMTTDSDDGNEQDK